MDVGIRCLVFDVVHGFFSSLLAPAHEDYDCAPLRCFPCGRKADAAVASGDDEDLLREGTSEGRQGLVPFGEAAVSLDHEL